MGLYYTNNNHQRDPEIGGGGGCLRFPDTGGFIGFIVGYCGFIYSKFY